MDAAWRAGAHHTMWRLDADPRLGEIRETARRIARDVVTPALAAGAADSPVWTAAKARVLDALDRALCPPGTDQTAMDSRRLLPGIRWQSGLSPDPGTQLLALAAAELAVADGGAATCLLSGYLAHSVVRDFGTPEQRARYLDRARYPHGALCLTEPPPGAGVDALTLTGHARLAVLPGAAPPGAAPLLDVEKRGRLISHMEFADFVLLAVDSPGGGCLIVAEPSDEAEGLFDRGQPVRTLGHRLSSVTSPAFRLRLPACRILGGYDVEDGRLVPRVGYRQALEPALGRCRPVVALMTAGKLLATMESVLAQGFACHGGAGFSLPTPACGRSFSRPLAEPFPLRLVDAWADAEAAAALALEAARMSDRLDAATASPAGLSAEAADVTDAAPEAAMTGAAAEAADSGGAAEGGIAVGSAESVAAAAGPAAEVTLTGAAARLFATAHAAPHMAQYAGLPNVLGRMMDAQVEAVYLGAESVQRRQLAAAMAAPAFPSRLAAWTAEAGESATLRAGLALFGWTLEFLRRTRLLSDASQGAGFALADALCRLLAARALAAGVRTLHAAGSRCLGFFTDLSVVESAAAASAVAHVSTSLVFGYAAPGGPAEEDRRGLSRLRAAVDASLAGVPAARLRAAAFLLAARRKRGSAQSPKGDTQQPTADSRGSAEPSTLSPGREGV